MKKETPNKSETKNSDKFQLFDYSISHLKLGNNISDIIIHGLTLFSNFPNANSASLFLLNEETFEFDHRATVPFNLKNEIINTFNNLIENGSIGNALELGNNYLYVKDPNIHNDKNAIVIPLIVSSGVLGLVLLVLYNDTTNINNISLSSLSLPSALFATKIENALLLSSLDKVNSLVEQQVAARSINLTKSNRELEAILNSVQAGIVVIDTQSDLILNINPTAMDILGIKGKQLLGQSSAAFFDLLINEEETFDDRVKFSRNFVSLINRNDNNAIPILRTFSNINLGNNKFRIESFVDISEQKKAENQLKNANELLELKVQERTEDLQLLVYKLKEEIAERKKAENELSKMLEKEKELNTLKTQFISMVSHEFRTPMTIIKTAAQMAEKFKTKLSVDDIHEYLQKINRAVDSMTILIDNVIFIGKSESENLGFNLSSVNIIDLCKEIINDIKQNIFINRNIRFQYDCINTDFNIDTNLFKQIIFNLLTNACKYSPEIEPIDFEISHTSEYLIIKIQDYGIGIPENEQANIFEMFYRGSNVGNISGTGLGLAIVHRSLELFGGKIDISSKVNKGAIFTIYLPIL